MKSPESASALEARSVPTMEFIGVTTTRSLIMRVFPRWAKVLGLEGVRLVGRDLPLNADPAPYRRAVEQIRDDPLSVGALVTAHKINLLRSARDLFDELDPFAELTGEVSSISKREGRVVGHAKDPITAGRSLAAVLGPGYFGRTGGEVLCIGAGGSGTAISVYLMTRPDSSDRPARIVMVGRSRRSLNWLREVHERLEGTAARVEYVENADPRLNDRLMAGLPPGSVVVNATGMGKDLPGSPITDEGLFPQSGVAWELNYRGELGFLHQARRQQNDQNLTVEDGWLYFLHGWSEVVSEVFRVELTDERFRALRAEAEAARD